MNRIPIFVVAAVFFWGACGDHVGAQGSRETMIDCHVRAIVEVNVAAEEAGKLVMLAVEEGDTVNEDSVIAQIDDRDAVMSRAVAMYQYKAAKKQAENSISIEAAIKSQEVSKAELDKALASNEKVKGSFSDIDVRRLRLTYQRNGLQIDLARFENDVAAAEARARYAQFEQASAMIERRKLVAPHTGLVNEVFRHKGDWVNAGDPVVHLVRMDTLRVQGRVSAEEYNWEDLKGKPVQIVVTLAGGEPYTVDGTIGFAGEYIEPDGAFRVWADIPNERQGNSWKMGPGLEAKMKLQ